MTETIEVIEIMDEHGKKKRMYAVQHGADFR